MAPSTLAHGLSDSPAGMLAWILERWVSWSDNGGDVETVFTKDDLCTHATIYWATHRHHLRRLREPTRGQH